MHNLFTLLGTQGAAVGQPHQAAHQAAADKPSQRGTRNTEQNFMGKGPIFRCRRKPRVWNRQTKFTFIGERKVYNVRALNQPASPLE